MSIDAVIAWFDSVGFPLCIALLVFGVVLATADSVRGPTLLRLRGFKLMAAPVFLLPVLWELRWIAHSPLSASDDFVLWLVTMLLSVAGVAGGLAALVWLIRLRRPEKT